MKKILFLLIFFSDLALALEAVVTVLETPMLKYQSTEAPVVQYLRRGDVIKIDPSLAATDSVPGELISTLDRQGHKVFVIAEHLYIYYGDSREFQQTTSNFDPTDYRLEEPLTKNYPFKTVTGYRGQVVFGVSSPYTESYPYAEDIKTKGYRSPMDVNITLLKQARGKPHERLFIGATVHVKYFENSYLFSNGRSSTEETLKMGLGPTISYDAYKGLKNRLNLSASVIVNLIDRLNIQQADASQSDSRLYKALSFFPRLSMQYHRKAVIEDIDFVLGTQLEMLPPTRYSAKEGGSATLWWQNLGNDTFSTRTTYALSAFLGFQTAY